MSFEETLKEYFNKIVKEDTAIKAVYDEAKINECVNYIVSCAEKQESKNCAVVSDEIVYKWARDFYLGDIEGDYKAEETPQAEVLHDDEMTDTKPNKAKITKSNFEKKQLNLFEF